MSSRRDVAERKDPVANGSIAIVAFTTPSRAGAANERFHLRDGLLTFGS